MQAVLQQLAEDMFPEGQGRRNAAAKLTAVADMTNALFVNAKKAVEVGLASQMVARGRALEVARRTAAQAARYDAHTTAACKRFMKPIPRDQLQAEQELFIELFGRPQVRDALRAFCESTDLRPYLA